MPSRASRPAQIRPDRRSERSGGARPNATYGAAETRSAFACKGCRRRDSNPHAFGATDFEFEDTAANGAEPLENARIASPGIYPAPSHEHWLPGRAATPLVAQLVAALERANETIAKLQIDVARLKGTACPPESQTGRVVKRKTQPPLDA